MLKYGQLDLDLSKLSRYIVPRLKVKTRSNSQSTYVRMDWRKCQVQDFVRMGYQPKEAEYTNIRARLCPDVTKALEEMYKIKNSYTDQEERISFSIEIEKCSSKTRNFCKKDGTIQAFLNNVYFTLYYT